MSARQDFRAAISTSGYSHFYAVPEETYWRTGWSEPLHDEGVIWMREPNGLGQEPRSVGRILVVDDERDVCHVARVLFAADGYLVETACDVAEGLQSARSFLPDVILADLRLPDRGDGHEFARRLRLESNLPQPFLFALTGSADAEEKRSALEAGFNEVLVKPLDYGQFLDRVAVMRQQSCQKPTLALSNPA